VVRCERWACWRRYEVSEMKLAKGVSSPFSADHVTNSRLKSLLAWVKSYVARRTAASCPGLQVI
jgi:hypothetical protein